MVDTMMVNVFNVSGVGGKEKCNPPTSPSYAYVIILQETDWNDDGINFRQEKMQYLK